MVSFKGSDIISIREFSRTDLEFILGKIEKIKENYSSKSSLLAEQARKLETKRGAVLFFEPSTRTRVSSELALRDLDIFADGFSGTEGTSVKKGEPLKDTIMMFQSYLNEIIFIRHPLEGGARYAAEISNVPVVNCGDGSNQHPTQTILDLFSIKESQGRLEDLTIALVGDLIYGRTTHSLLMGLSKFPGMRAILVSPDSLQMDPSYINYYIQKTGMKPEINSDLIDAMSKADIVYMTRIQRERFPEGKEGDFEYQKVSGIYKLNRALIEKAKPKENMRILHPLPRFKENLEISFDVDDLPYAYFYQQAQNGLFTRTALTSLVLGLTDSNFELEGESEITDFQRQKEIQKADDSGKPKDFFTFNNGTFIDRIERGKLSLIEKILEIENDEKYPDIVLSLKKSPSIKYGKKDCLGISGVYLSQEDLTKIALVSKTARINYIEGGKVIKKFEVYAPAEINGLVKCLNLRCITNPDHDEHVPTKFINLQIRPESDLVLRCAYCEKEIPRDNIELT